MCNICNLDDLNHLRYCSPKYLNKPTFPHFTVAVHSWQINLLLGDLEKREEEREAIWKRERRGKRRHNYLKNN